MNQTDQRHHPWPETGRLFEFRWRRAVWMSVRPWYKTAQHPEFSEKDITRMFIWRGWFPFLTWNIKIKNRGIHGYIGWKPIPVAKDAAFRWRNLTAAQNAITDCELFVQLSARGGIGAIS